MMYKKNITSSSLYEFLTIIILIFKISNSDCDVRQLDFSEIKINDHYSVYLSQYKKGKFKDNTFIKTTYEIINIVQELHNIYIQHKDHIFYMNLIEMLNNMFKEIQIIINRNQSLN